jgi:3-dehydroquinate synthase
MPVLTVALGQRSYPIHIDEQVFAQADLLLPHIAGRQVMLVSNTTVAPLYLAPVRETLVQAGLSVAEVILPDGEQYKDWQHLQLIFDALLQARFGRKVTLIALGGGVIGDMTGFAAATYQRGVSFIQIPTTLLAQVDSSVGGKTGINHPLGKNMIGAFMQPQVVLADTAVLRTLPDRELSAGLAEVIKYGLIRDSQFLCWLHDNMSALVAREPTVLAEAVARSCQHKAEVVAADELEQHDVRALLNFGHTFGHAIETNMGYGDWLHGEAVAIGMLMAADLSQRMGWISAAEVDELRTLLLAAGLPVQAPKAISQADFLAAMAVDKKNVDGQLRLVLLKRIGSASVVDMRDLSLVRDTLAAAGITA